MSGRFPHVEVMACLLLALTAQPAFTQGQPGPPTPLDPTFWPNIYQIPGMDDVRVARNIAYSRDAQGDLRIDLYAPRTGSPGPRPAVVFINGVGAPDLKDWPIYTSWARLVATEGLVGITVETRGAATPVAEQIRALFSFLEREGSRHGIDATRMAVFAASANVEAAGNYLMAGNAARGIRAATLYYGSVPQSPLRADLPVLFVVAEGDIGGQLAAGYPNLWSAVMTSRAPWTLTFGRGLPHAFDAFTETDEARRLVQQTLAFLATQLRTPPRGSSLHAEERALVAAQFMNDPPRLEQALRAYLGDHPANRDVRQRLGAFLVQAGRHAEAVAELEPLRGPSSSPFVNDLLGQAYLGTGRTDAAIESFQAALGGGVRTPQLYLQLATAQWRAGRLEDAAATFEAATEIGFPKSWAYYNMARIYSRLGQPDRAFQLLGRALDEGFNDRAMLERNPDLAPLRSDARFQALLRRLG